MGNKLANLKFSSLFSPEEMESKRITRNAKSKRVDVFEEFYVCIQIAYIAFPANLLYDAF